MLFHRKAVFNCPGRDDIFKAVRFIPDGFFYIKKQAI